MKKKFTVPMLMMAVLLAAALNVSAQIAATGSISGYVTDNEKEALPGAAVIVTSPTMVGSRQAISDTKGYFRLPALPPGRYKIVVEMAQFKTQVRENIELNIMAMLRVDFELEAATVEKEVVVTASAPMVETEKTTMDTVVSTSILNALPILDRDFMSSLRILPGVTQGSYGLSISGGRDTDKNYNIDGSDNVDIVQGQIYTGGDYALTLNRSFMTFDSEAIQELSVGRGAYSADMGFGSGGLINVVTKSGSNAFHGSLYLQVRDDNLDYKPVYAYHQYYFGGSLGGAVIKDKLLFFSSISPSYGSNGYDKREIYSGNIPESLRDKSLDLGVFLKLTYLLNKSNTLNLSTNLSFSKYDTYYTLWHVDPDFPEGTYKNNGAMVSLVESATLNPNLLLESMLSFGRTFDKTINASGAHPGLIMDYGPWTATGTSFIDEKMMRAKLNWSEKMTLFVEDWGGRHTIASGVELRYNGSRQERAYSENIAIYPPDAPSFMPAKIITFADAFDLKLHQTYLAGYVSDSWMPIKRLTLKPGVRVSRNSFMPKVLLEPRFDFAYDLFGDAHTVLRGGANFYYERMNSYVQQLANYPMWRRTFYFRNGQDIETTEAYRNNVIDPNLKYPTTKELTLGFERALAKDLDLSVDFIYRKYEDQLFSRFINLEDPLTGERDDPTKGALNYYSNLGFSDYKGLHVILQKIYSHGYQFLLSYSYQYSRGNSNLFLDFSQLQNIFQAYLFRKGDFQMADIVGRTAYDKPYDFKAFGSVTLPLEIVLAAVFNYTSGSPYTSYNSDTQQIVSAYQALRSPHTMILDVRLQKEFRVKAIALKVMAEAFNITNRANVTEVFADVSSPDYLMPYQIGEPRRIQLSARVEW